MDKHERKQVRRAHRKARQKRQADKVKLRLPRCPTCGEATARLYVNVDEAPPCMREALRKDSRVVPLTQAEWERKQTEWRETPGYDSAAPMWKRVAHIHEDQLRGLGVRTLADLEAKMPLLEAERDARFAREDALREQGDGD